MTREEHISAISKALDVLNRTAALAGLEGFNVEFEDIDRRFGTGGSSPHLTAYIKERVR